MGRDKNEYNFTICIWVIVVGYGLREKWRKRNSTKRHDKWRTGKRVEKCMSAHFMPIVHPPLHAQFLEWRPPQHRSSCRRMEWNRIVKIAKSKLLLFSRRHLRSTGSPQRIDNFCYCPRHHLEFLIGWTLNGGLRSPTIGKAIGYVRIPHINPLVVDSWMRHIHTAEVCSFVFNLFDILQFRCVRSTGKYAMKAN